MEANMKYSEFIKVDEKFQTSINLEYDLNKVDKISSYIPTEQSVSILHTYLSSIYYDNTERAKVLIGPYGRGKSHLLLILTALTSLDVGDNNANSEINTRTLKDLCEKIRIVNPETGALVEEVLKSKIRLLPVIVNSNSGDINQAFIRAFRDALINANLQNLLPETYFDSAAAVLEKWKQSFPDAYSKLSQELNKRKIKYDDLYISLQKYDQEAYQLFCDCYPIVAAGTEFNPLSNTDVVKLYSSVNNTLCEQTPYTGINIIFDEFSKFLEANLEKSKMLNFKIIQDMAELSSRSGRKQMHFTCITHKEILDYSTGDSFKTVEGRFKNIRFVSSSEQSYELIANAIHKGKAYEQFKKEHASEFHSMMHQAYMTGIFSDLSEDTFEKKLVYGCFPMSPISSYALLRVSEKVAQNERTLFTFLAQNDINTLASFIKQEYTTLNFLTVEYIYGYFEELFKKEVFNTSVHIIWSKANSAIRQITKKDQINIIKAIAIIGIVGDEKLRPISTHIRASLLMDDNTFSEATQSLMKKKILSLRESSEYVLLTANGVDVQNKISNYVKTKLSRINYCEALDAAVDLGFVLPREYNDKYCMLRYFKNIFMYAEVFLKILNYQQLQANYPYDGLIINIISNDLSINQKLIDKVQQFKNQPQIIICISSQAFEYYDLLKKFIAAQQLRKTEEALLDPHYLEEIEVFEEDIRKSINKNVQNMFFPNSAKSLFYNCDGALLSVYKQLQLNKEVSRICLNCYNLTPIINNEMVNKNSLTSPIQKARNEVSSWIFAHSDDKQLPAIEGNSPEASIFRSVIKKTGLDRIANTQDDGLNAALTQVQNFIISAEKRKRNFDSLYQILLSAPYGLRKGIIPIFIAYALRPYKENVVLYFAGKEVELSASLLDNINDTPSKYQLLLESGTNEKEEYLGKLERLFNEYEDTRSNSINRIYRIVKSMQNWIRSLPDYTKKYSITYTDFNTEPIKENVILLRRELLKFDINSRQLLFDTFTQNMSRKKHLKQYFDEIEACKSILDSHIHEFKKVLTKRIQKIINIEYQGGLSQAIMHWYGTLSSATKTHMFDATINVVLQYISNLNNYDDKYVTSEIAIRVTTMSIEDWNDTLAEQFITDIHSIVAKINDYNILKNDNTIEDEYKVLISYEGNTIEKSFNNGAISALGMTILNNLESAFDEYNDSIEPNEKMAIILKLMKDLID
jgi:hypothetical protein